MKANEEIAFGQSQIHLYISILITCWKARKQLKVTNTNIYLYIYECVKYEIILLKHRKLDIDTFNFLKCLTLT